MKIDMPATDWSTAQFGAPAAEVARRVVQALTDAQQVGTHTQRASGQRRLNAYGSTWTSKYEQMIYQFTEAGGEELPPVEIMSVRGAPYELVKVNGRLMIPFVLARSLGEASDEPTMTSEVLRLITARTVPASPSPPALFELHDDRRRRSSVPVPEPRAAHEATAPVLAADETPPVFIGCVCNADSEPLLAVRWGNAKTIDIGTGRITWSPELLPLQLATLSDGPRRVPDPRGPRRAGAFDEGVVPNVAVVARPQPIAHGE